MKGVSYRYPDGTPGLDGVSFLFRHGESVGIVGANGAGKSTLLMLLMGLDFPQEGQVLVGDIPVGKNTLGEIRRRAGLVMQNAEDMLFMPTVYDDVAFGPRNEGLDEAEVRRRAEEALAAVGLPDLGHRSSYKLSGGEKKAVSIAAVLAMDPDILLMDEPTAGLDPLARRRLIGQLNGFSHTKIITSHDLEMILDTCSRVIVLSRGRIAADGAPDAILSDGQALAAWGLELPPSFAPRKSKGCP
jgi:cobalt/nickel transport system ATP-binding protein